MRCADRHSRLVGSQDLERWGRQAASAALEAWQQHVLQPLLTVRDELFQTFRQKRSIVEPADFEADKESLMRMLTDFRRDNASGKLVPPKLLLTSSCDLPKSVGLLWRPA